MSDLVTAAAGAHAAPSALRVEVIRTTSELAALGVHWDALLGESADGNVFLSWDWTDAWWEAFGAGKELTVAVVKRGDEHLGIAPLYRARSGPGALRWIGSGESVSPDHLTFVLRRGDEAEATRALLNVLLAESGGAGLDLTDVPEKAPLMRLLADGEDDVCWAAHQWAVCPYAPLPGSWQAYEGQLRAKTRYSLRRKARKLMRDQGGELLTFHTEAEAEAGLALVARLHRLRWQGRAERFSFSDAGYLAFHGEFARRAARRGWLRLYGLRVGGEVIAAWYGFLHGDVLYHYQGGFDPAWEAFSPGVVLQWLAVREGIETGAREFDLLKGDHAYKRLWATGSRRTLRVIIARRGLRGYAVVAPAWIEASRRRLRAALASMPRRERAGAHREGT